MDLDDFRSILDTAGVDVWTFIDTAILVASLDYGQELKRRRDNIVERLYATSMVSKCRNCDFNDGERVATVDEVTEVEEKEKEHEISRRLVDGDGNGGDDGDGEDDDGGGFDPCGGLFDDEQKRILEIKEQLEDPDNLPEESLVELLQSLADMDITFKSLQETDIGRYVNRVRKHSSNNVRRIAKQLVRKWKETVDEWVKLNPPGELAPSTLMADGDSPQPRMSYNGHQQQVTDFAYSPNPQNGSSGSDRNNSEPERKPKPRPVPPPPRKEAESPAKPSRPSPAPQHTQQNTQREREQRERRDPDLESARKRLQQNYREAENAKKQRTIQVMDIHEIPKPKKSFFPKKGGGGGTSHGRHW